MIDLHIVAVRQENPFAGKLHDPGRSIDLHSALRFEIVTNPHVVITRHENHPNPPVGQFAQLSQYAHKPFGNDPFVFEPEIEKVAQNKDRIGIAGNFVEPRHETFLDRTGRSRPSRAQMNVRCEVIHSLFELRFERPLQPRTVKIAGHYDTLTIDQKVSQAVSARCKAPVRENFVPGNRKPKSREAAAPARR